MFRNAMNGLDQRYKHLPQAQQLLLLLDSLTQEDVQVVYHITNKRMLLQRQHPHTVFCSRLYCTEPAQCQLRTGQPRTNYCDKHRCKKCAHYKSSFDPNLCFSCTHTCESPLCFSAPLTNSTKCYECQFTPESLRCSWRDLELPRLPQSACSQGSEPMCFRESDEPSLGDPDTLSE